MKHIEYMLLTALMGAITLGFGTVIWSTLSHLSTIFTQITQALQVNP
jgi:Flp pilus assembly pilin Flp